MFRPYEIGHGHQGSGWATFWAVLAVACAFALSGYFDSTDNEKPVDCSKVSENDTLGVDSAVLEICLQSYRDKIKPQVDERHKTKGIK